MTGAVQINNTMKLAERKARQTMEVYGGATGALQHKHSRDRRVSLAVKMKIRSLKRCKRSSGERTQRRRSEEKPQ